MERTESAQRELKEMQERGIDPVSDGDQRETVQLTVFSSVRNRTFRSCARQQRCDQRITRKKRAWVRCLSFAPSTMLSCSFTRYSQAVWQSGAVQAESAGLERAAYSQACAEAHPDLELSRSVLLVVLFRTAFVFSSHLLHVTCRSV